MSFEPDILGFACNWCGYAGADGAGMAKLQYPANIRIVRLMCLGRTEPNFIMEAFDQGYDGVVLFGCHLGDCHYVSGNMQAEEFVQQLKRLLDTLGLGRDRLRREETSSAEGVRLAALVHEFREQLIALGPNPLKTDGELAMPAIAESHQTSNEMNQTSAGEP